MIELEPADYWRAAALLDRAPFNVLMAQAVAAGRVGGQIYADATDPSSVYVRHMYGMSWLVGYPEHPEFTEEVAETIADPAVRTAPEWLQVYPLDWTETIDPLVAAGSVTAWHRTNFWFNQVRFQRSFARSDGDTVRCTKDEVDRFEGSTSSASTSSPGVLSLPSSTCRHWPTSAASWSSRRPHLRRHTQGPWRPGAITSKQLGQSCATSISMSAFAARGGTTSPTARPASAWVESTSTSSSSSSSQVK